MPDRNRFADVQQRIDSIVAILDGWGYTRDTEDIAQRIVANDRNRDNVIPAYSRALDDLYDLRVASASEARIHEVHTELAVFPKSRRAAAAESVERLRAATRQVNAAATFSVETTAVGDEAGPETDRVNIIAYLLVKGGVSESHSLDIAERIAARHVDSQTVHYLAAIAEVAELRRIFGEEADVIDAHLAFKSFPKSRRDIAEGQILRMRAIANGKGIRHHYGYINSRVVEMYLREAGAKTGLTRSMWELNRAIA